MDQAARQAAVDAAADAAIAAIVPPSSRRDHRGVLPRLAVVLFIVAGFGIYLQTADFAFQRYWDDAVYVTLNAHVNRGLDWDAFVAAWIRPQASNWHPLTMLAHALDVSLFGLWAGGHHLVSSGIHLLVVWAGYRLLRQCALSPSTAGLAMFVFLVHPLQAETVAWIAERKNLLCALFWILAAQQYLHWHRGSGRHGELLCFAFGLLALLAKPAAVMLPLTLLLLDYWPLGRLPGGSAAASPANLVGEKLPLLILAAVVGGMTVYVQYRFGSTGLNAHLTLADRLGNALSAYGSYLAHFVVPTGLHYLYPWRAPDWIGRVLPSAAVLTGISSVLWRVRRTQPAALFAWLWFLLVPLPTLGLIQVGAQTSADRYTYVPLLGLCLLASLGAEQLGALRGWVGRSILAALLLTLTLAAHHQVGTWKDDNSRLARTLALDPTHCGARLSVVIMRLDDGQIDAAGRLFGAAAGSCRGPEIVGWTNRLARRIPVVGEAQIRRGLPRAKTSAAADGSEKGNH